MKNKLSTILTAIFCSLFFTITLSADNTKNTESNGVKQQTESIDKRISLGLTAAEKEDFLAEMRQMLNSIQGIMAGIGSNDRSLIIKRARYSGNRMARETPESVKKKTPAEFKQLGGPTHMKFEELAVRAEDDDMDELAALTGDLMKNCLACHAMFKVE